MSKEDVEVVRKAVEAVNRRDPDAFTACLSPEVEWIDEPPDANPFPGLRGTYRGRAEVRGWLKAVVEPWESFHIEVEEITEAGGGCVFWQVLLAGRGRASGLQIEIRAWEVLWFVDGKIARRQIYGTRECAVEAAGLAD